MPRAAYRRFAALTVSGKAIASRMWRRRKRGRRTRNSWWARRCRSIRPRAWSSRHPKKARRIVVNPEVPDGIAGPGFEVVAKPATVGGAEVVAGLLAVAGAPGRPLQGAEKGLQRCGRFRGQGGDLPTCFGCEGGVLAKTGAGQQITPLGPPASCRWPWPSSGPSCRPTRSGSLCRLAEQLSKTKMRAMANAPHGRAANHTHLPDSDDS